MLNDSLTRVSWRARPRSFVSLMGLYESNHVRLDWLAGQVGRLRGTLVSRVRGDCDLMLRIVEHSPYTTTLNLTYLLSGDGLSNDGMPADEAAASTFPDMGVRVYHDARLVEAQEWAQDHAHAGLRALRGAVACELYQRWGRNMMLNKWLEYCVDRGYRFTPAIAPARA